MTGPRAADGSPVELYARLPTYGEPEIVHAAIAPSAEILELGAGAGRMTRRLVELGHRVTAVDSSAEMLAHVTDAELVHSRIEELDLGRRFETVLLASHLVNVEDERERHLLLAACARHVAPDGVVVIQRYDPAWSTDPRPGSREVEGVETTVVEARRDGPFLHGIVEYRIGDERWRHGPFTSRILDDRELDGRLRAAGLGRQSWLDEARSWLTAVLEPDTSGLYVPVPEAEPLAGQMRWLHDPVAPAGVPTHVTVLYPFVPPASVDETVIGRLQGILAGSAPFTCRFAEVGRWEHLVYLAPEPTAPFLALTDALHAAWPDHPPYGGIHPEVIPHLTVADGAPDGELDRVAAELALGLPIEARADRVELVVRRSGRWELLADLPLGPAVPRDR